jgi:hypothetical protein
MASWLWLRPAGVLLFLFPAFLAVFGIQTAERRLPARAHRFSIS